MKVTQDKIEERQAFLSVEVEPEELKKSLDRSYRRLAKKANIPGFRKGKAPREVLERYVGKDGLLEEALRDLVPRAYDQAVKEQALDAISQPQIEVTQTEPMVRFKATVPLRPTVDLGEYHRIKLKPEAVEVKDDGIDAVIEQLRHQHADWEPVERPVAYKDMASIDVESSIGDMPFINQQGAQYLVAEDSNFPATGFSKELVGMGRDDEKEFQLTISAEHPNKEIAGKPAAFKVKVVEVKQEKLPDLDDEFAKVVDPDIADIKALRERIATDLRCRAEKRERAKFEEKLITEVADRAKIEFPPVMADREVDLLFSDRLERWRRDGGDLEEYLENVGKTEKEIRAELRPIAVKRLKWSLVLGEVAEKEDINVAKEDIDAEIERTLIGAEEKHLARIKKALNSPASRQSIEQSLLTRRTIERLANIVQGLDTDEGEDEQNKKKEAE